MSFAKKWGEPDEGYTILFSFPEVLNCFQRFDDLLQSLSTFFTTLYMPDLSSSSILGLESNGQRSPKAKPPLGFTRQVGLLCTLKMSQEDHMKTQKKMQEGGSLGLVVQGAGLSGMLMRMSSSSLP